MDKQTARANGDSAAELVVITFAKEITPRDASFNGGKPFKEVTWHNVWQLHEGIAGLKVQFEPQGPKNFYPWHSIDRVKVQRF